MVRERKFTKLKIILFILIVAVLIGIFEFTKQISTNSLQQSAHGLGAGIQKEKGFGVVSATSIGGDNAELLNAVEATSDGGYIVGGEFNSYDLYFGNEEIPYEQLTEKELKLDGMVSGIIVKYDKSGKVAWANVVNAEEGVCITDVKETKDGDYVVVGYFCGYYIKVGDYILANEGDCITQGFAIKYSSTGNIKWAKCLEDDNHIKIITAVEVTKNDEYILVGSGIEYERSKMKSASMDDPNADGLVTCLDTNGNIKWTDYFGDLEQDVITSISLTNDDGFILGGLTLDTDKLKNSAPQQVATILAEEVSEVINSENGISNVLHGFVAKYKKGFSMPRKVNSDDTYGRQWYRTINETTNNAVISVISTEDNGYAIVGGYNGNMQSVNNNLKEAECTNGMIIKYSENGNVEWANSIGDRGLNLFTTLIKTNTGDFITTGIFISPSTQIGDKEFRNLYYSYDSELIKYSKDGNVISSGSIESNMESANLVLRMAELETGKYVTVGGYIGTVGEYSYGTTADDNLLLPNRTFQEEESESLGIQVNTNRNEMNLPPIDAMIVKVEEKDLINPIASYGTNIGNDGEDEITYVKNTSDGGYLALGYYDSDTIKIGDKTLNIDSDGDAFIIKYDKNNNIEWVNSMGKMNINEIISVDETKDGEYIAVGYFEDENVTIGDKQFTNKGYSDALLIKYSQDGEVDWVNTFGENGYDELNFVKATKDGGYVVGGFFTSNTLNLGENIVLENIDSTVSEGLIIKYNSENEVEWAKSVQGYGEQSVYSVAELEDNRIVAVGYSMGHDEITVDGNAINSNYGMPVTLKNKENKPARASLAYEYEAGFVVEFNQNGEYTWSEYEDIDGYVTSVIATKDGGFVIGMSSLYDGGIIEKYDKYNELTWGTTLGVYYSEIMQLSETRDGGILVGGLFAGDYYQVGDYRLNNAYKRSYERLESINLSSISEYCYDDYGYYEPYDGLIAKFTIDGDIEWADSIGGLDDDYVNSITELVDGSVVVGGYYYSESMEKDSVKLENQGDLDGYILRITNIPSVRAETTVTVKYQDTEGNALAEDIVMQGYEEDPYTTEEKQFDKYRLVEVKGEKEGVFTETSKEIVYVYEKIQGTVIIKYLEKGTNKELAPQEELKGPLGEEYEVTRKNIENYKASEPEPENTKGVFTEEPITIVFYYRIKTMGEVKVEYVDKDTKEVLDSKIINGNVGEEYTTEQLEIPYYKFVEVSGKTSGKYTENKIAITYYYQKLKLDFSINKQLENVKVDGQNVDFSNKNLIKLEVVGSNVDKTDIEVTYNIEVKNVGELDGKVKLSEIIPDGFEVVNKDELFTENNSTLEAEIELKAGESKNLKITIRWMKGNNNLGEQISETKITSISNEANFIDVDESNNTAKVTMLLAIKTGLQRNIMIIISLITILSIMIIIRKNKTKTKIKKSSCIY